MSTHPIWRVYLPKSDTWLGLRMCCLKAAQDFVEEHELDKQLDDQESARQAAFDDGYEEGVDIGERNLSEAKVALRKVHELVRGW